MQTKFDVTQMTCSACSAHVEKAVAKVKGVSKVTVSLLTNSMVVEHSCSAQEIIDAVVKIGYGATVMGKQSNASKQKPQTQVTLGRLIASLALCLVLMYVAMGHMANLPLPTFLSGSQNAVNFAFAQLLLCLPVWYLNRSYFAVGFKKLFSGAPNMDSLIAIGSSAGGLYGIVIIFILGSAVGRGDMATVNAYHHQLYFESSAMILALVDLGKYFEGKSKAKTGDALSKLKKLAPQNAILLVDKQETTVDYAQIKVGDVVVVKAGMTIPCDGVVTQGSCFVDQSALTGESIPVEKQIGDKVIGGTVNVGGYLQITVSTVGEQSTLAKIISLVESASTSKAPIQKLADKISLVFVPVVVGIAIVTLAVWLACGYSFYQALDFAISVLVISCPCALGLATPIALMVATGKGAEYGILVKNGEILQKLSTVQAVVFDKTGTLTEGKPQVDQIICNGDQKEFLSVVAGIEKFSEHPLGKAVVEYAESQSIALVTPMDFQTVVGKGVVAKVDGSSYAIGNKSLMMDFSVQLPDQTQNFVGKTVLFVAKENQYLGAITVADKIKQTSLWAVEQLKAMGIKTALLSGDNDDVAKNVCQQLGIDEYYAQVLPHQKAEKIRQIQQNYVTAMVGDGINDAPALVTADVGFAVAQGTDIAVDSADVVLVNDDLQNVATALKLSKSTVKNIKQNLFWAFFYNALGIPLASGVLYLPFGIKLVPMIGALAMSLSSLFVVTNALRLRLFKSKNKVLCPTICPISNEVKGENMKFQLKIQGMMCSHCTGRVQQTLKNLQGVVDVVVSLENQTAVVTTTQDIADILRSAVESQGYPVLEVTQL